MWEITSIIQEPLKHSLGCVVGVNPKQPTGLVDAIGYVVSLTTPISSFLGNDSSILSSFHDGGTVSCVALADFASRQLLAFHQRNATTEIVAINENNNENNNCNRPRIHIRFETLDEDLLEKKRNRRTRTSSRSYPPYVVERSDFYCKGGNLRIIIRAIVRFHNSNELQTKELKYIKTLVSDSCQATFRKVFPVDNPTFQNKLLQHISCVVLQQRLRLHLSSMKAVAFICDGCILPRRSGGSASPMASPPAIPFQAPSNSPMSTTITIDMGSLKDYVPSFLLKMANTQKSTTVIVLSGLLILQGVTLICGGGYHGKSTTLQAIALGHYDKIPGDGRELCVSVLDAVVVRAEDGRYVNNCNISAFISNLPTPPGSKSQLDTQHFSTRDASGSTSQATNVIEAIELGATCLLVDEDISAANFMARDGRMRALVMDESITPLLYRVNGLYNTHKISSVVVVGGVGDWLDVPHNVILLDKYIVHDATHKARSISSQFSYGHVQYAGRGVVHRLEWEKKFMPIPRRPKDSFSQRFGSNVIVSLLDNGRGLHLYEECIEKEDDVDANISITGIVDEANDCDDFDEEEEETKGTVDTSRLEQMLGKRQLLAIGFCVAWILQKAPQKPDYGLRSLLHLLDSELNEGGLDQILQELYDSDCNNITKSFIQVIDSVGFLERPRVFEIGQVLTRLYGIEFEEIIQMNDDESNAQEEQNKRKALAELWASRRSR